MVGRVFLGRYQALRLLGEGGMGRVYLARQLDLGRQVVVKIMHDHLASDPQFCERFQRETLVMARFQHPYAVTLYDASLNDPQGPCIVMEYIRGVTLDVLAKNSQGRLSPGRLSRLLGQLCEVLQAAHTAGIIHRDLKPANLMIADPDTPYEKLKVMDFGLAKLVASPTLKQVSVPGGDFAMGTPTYISPEQIRGEPLDHRCDLYSVGVILYEMLTGKTPFGDDSTMEILLSHATETPPTFTECGALNIPAGIEQVVFSCLAKNPAERPPSARELAERFQAALIKEDSTPEIATVGELPPKPVAAPSRPAHDHGEPNSVVYHLEAWMPQMIAVRKLSGFMDDVGGEVLESNPGQIRVRLGGPGSIYQFPTAGKGSWFPLRRKSDRIDVDLRMRQVDPDRQNLLHITVSMRSVDGDSILGPVWRESTDQVFCDLRGYLMGNVGVVAEAMGRPHGT
jgi:serine/threonine-protein kinase